MRIAGPNDRDRVSSKGWAFGYLGGGLLLLLNFVLVAKPDLVGLDKGGAVRVSLLMAGVWWAAFTIIPVRGLRNVNGTVAPPVAPGEGVVGGSLRQLRETFRDLALPYPPQ